MPNPQALGISNSSSFVIILKRLHKQRTVAASVSVHSATGLWSAEVISCIDLKEETSQLQLSPLFSKCEQASGLE